MKRPVWNLLAGAFRYKKHLTAGIIFHILTACLTVISIPLVIPFFQIIFDKSPSSYTQPTSSLDLESWLTYGFSRLVAMSDAYIALSIVCILVVIIFFLKNLCRYMINYFMTPVRNGIVKELRILLWKGYESMTLRQRQSHQQGHLLSLMTNDLQEIDHSVVKIYELLCKTPLIIIGSLIFMMWINLYLTLIAGALILFTLLVIGVISQILKKQSHQVQKELSVLTSLADQYLQGLKLIRTYNAESYFRQRYIKHTEQHLKHSNKMLRRRDLASPLAEFLGVATVVALLYFGTHAVLEGDIRPATFFAFIFAFYNIIDPAKSFAREYANLQKGTAALERINTFLDDHRSDDLAKDHLRKYDELKSDIVLSHVSYKHPDATEHLLQDINLSILANQKVGIIGKSGVGKSTLFDLILGHLNPTKGHVKVDDLDLESIDQSAYLNLFGWVGQRTELFYGTIKDNILLDKTEDTELLHEVMEKSRLSRDMLERKVGDSTMGLSGGESQRVSLARALYRSPEVMILDEPLSQLDDLHTSEIIDLLRSTIRDKTVLLITHNISLLKDMDRIILIKNGRLIELEQYDGHSDRIQWIKQMLTTHDI